MSLSLTKRERLKEAQKWICVCLPNPPKMCARKCVLSALAASTQQRPMAEEWLNCSDFPRHKHREGARTCTRPRASHAHVFSLEFEMWGLFGGWGGGGVGGSRFWTRNAIWTLLSFGPSEFIFTKARNYCGVHKISRRRNNGKHYILERILTDFSPFNPKDSDALERLTERHVRHFN